MVKSKKGIYSRELFADRSIVSIIFNTFMSSAKVLRLGLLLALVVVVTHQQSDDGLDEARAILEQHSSQINFLLSQSLQRSNTVARNVITVINADRDSVQRRIRRAYASTDVRGDIRSVAEKAILWTREFGDRKCGHVVIAENEIALETDRASEDILAIFGDTAAGPILENALRRIKNLLVKSLTQSTILTRQIITNTIRVAHLVSLRALRINRQAQQAGTSQGFEEQLHTLVDSAQQAVLQNFAIKDQKIVGVFKNLARNALYEIQPRTAIANYIADTEHFDDSCGDD